MTQNARRFSILMGIFALVFSLAGLVYAQAGHGGRMGVMMSMMQDCPMMSSAQTGPAAALEHRDELGLTADQVQRLEALQQSADAAQMRSMRRMHALHQEIAQATEGERFDEAAARRAFERMGEAHTEMGVAMLRTTHQTREILTAEQGEALAKLGGGMMGMHERMKNCPMMQGGTPGMAMENCPMMQGMMNPGGSGSMQHHDQD